MPETPSHQVNLLDFLAFLIRWRKFLLASIVGFAVAAGIISFVIKPVFRSTAVIHGTEQNSQGFGSFVAAKLNALSGITGMGQMFGETPAEMYMQILRSRWMNERLIDTFNLRRVYDMADVPLEQVIEVVKAHTRFEIDQTSLAVIIYSEDTDPRRSQAMTQFLVDELDKRNQDLRATSARKEREFVSQRLDDAKRTLSSLEDSLTRFQSATGMIDLSAQVKATVGAAAELEAQRLAVQTQLEMNRQVFGPRNPEVVYLQLRMSSLDSTIESLAGTTGSRRAGSEVLMNLHDAPITGLTYLRIARDIEVQQLLVGFLTQQFEQARIEEQRDTPTIMRIDPPVVATQKVWPRRSVMVAVGALAAFVFGILFALLFDFFGNASRDPSHPQHQRIVAIRRAWTGKRG